MMHLTRSFAASLLLVVSCFANASDKNQIFNEASKALNNANAAQANILAPEGYKEGSEHYQRAEVLFAKQRPLDRVQKSLDSAVAALKLAAKNAELARLTFAATLKARNDAKGVDAQRLSGDAWRDAEETLLYAASRLEDGNLKRAKSKAKEAEELYRVAELGAIKISYLSDARATIEKARKEKVHRHAPKTLMNAESLLAAAEKELTENRYDIDYPRTLAKQANLEAKHSLFLADMVKQLDKGKLTTEEFLLEQEKPLTEIASSLDMVAEFDQGFEAVTANLVAAIETLRTDAYELGERKKELARLETDMAILEKRMGIQSQRLAEQEAQRESLRQVSELFDREEASVMTEGRNILIRAVGLTFAPGSDQIDSRNFALLTKLQKAIALYPSFSVLIEGHTDAFGSDSANLNLSFARAESVKQYLQANIRNDRQIEAIGYGETRPIANNETASGREKNRRIDLVLRPPL